MLRVNAARIVQNKARAVFERDSEWTYSGVVLLSEKKVIHGSSKCQNPGMWLYSHRFLGVDSDHLPRPAGLSPFSLKYAFCGL